jgi:hypothetical protein
MCYKFGQKLKKIKNFSKIFQKIEKIFGKLKNFREIKKQAHHKGSPSDGVVFLRTVLLHGITAKSATTARGSLREGAPDEVG